MKWIRCGLVYVCSLGLSVVLYQVIIRHLFFIQYFFTVYHKFAMILLLSVAIFEGLMWMIHGFKSITLKDIKKMLVLQLLFILVVSIKPVETRSFSFYISTIPLGLNRSYLDIGNLLMYVPVGILLMYLWKNPIKVLLATLVGVFILETMQWITMFGIFDANDIFLNLLGVVIGIILYYGIKPIVKIIDH